MQALDQHVDRRQPVGTIADGILQDLRHAARSLRRSPAFALATLATLVVGVAALVTMFAIVNGILLRALPYPDPERLVGTWHDMPPVNLPHAQQAVQTYFTYRTQAHTIDGIGIYRETAANMSVVGQSADPQRVAVAGSTASLFRVLGAKPLLGRVFTEEEDRPGAAPVAVISEATWRSTLGGDPQVVGRKLDVNGVTREVVGVLPASFALPSSRIAVWIPLNLDPANPPANAFTYGGIARLKAGVSAAAAQRDFATVLPRAAELYPQFVPGITTREILAETQPRPVLTPLRDDVTGGVASTLWLMGAAAALLYLVACVNVGNLALVRFDARRSELAVRHALGAGGGRLARAYLTELTIVVATACVLALVVAHAVLRLLVSKGPADLPRLAELSLDVRCAGFAVLVSAFAAVASSAIPLAYIRRGALSLVRQTRGGTASRSEHRLRRSLVAAQVALGLVLIAGSGLLFRSFVRLQAVRPGFNPDHVATFWVSLPTSRYPRDTAVVNFYAALLDRARTLPGVLGTGLTSRLPLIARGFNDNPLYPEDDTRSDSKLPPLQLFTTVGGDYFRTIGIPLLSGRFFDAMSTQREGDAIVSSRTAATLWHDSTGQTVVGKRFRVLPTSRWYTIIGVVADTRDSSLATRSSPAVYFPETAYTDPAQRQTARTMALVLRTAGDPSTVTTAVRRVVRELDPSLPVFDVQPMSDAVRASTARLHFTTEILGAAAAVTLTLGAIGLYGVMAYLVVLRRRELGIRLALGATPGGVAAATTREALALSAAGLAAGLALFGVTAPFASTMLFGVSAWDPVTIAGATSTLLVMAVLASWIPARRAASVDPAEALRTE